MHYLYGALQGPSRPHEAAQAPSSRFMFLFILILGPLRGGGPIKSGTQDSLGNLRERLGRLGSAGVFVWTNRKTQHTLSAS